MQQKLLLGLDIGGTNIKIVLLSSSGEIIEKTHTPSQAQVSPEAVRFAIRSAVEPFLKGHSIVGIGIGCAGSVDHGNGVVRNSPNFQNWKNVPLRDWLSHDFGLPVVLDNDANCAVLAEWRLGAAKQANNVVLLTLGTGIGGGVIINGAVYRGSTGSASELGHFSIHSRGIWCPCGNRGCFERYCSASALVEKFPHLTAKEIIERATEEPYRKIVNEFIEDLSIGITSLGNIFDPDIILLGGAVSLGVKSYLTRVHAFVRSHVFPSISAHLRLSMTEFEHQSGAIGAALLCKGICPQEV